MSYIINRYNGTELVVLQDGTLDTTTSIGLVGRNYVGYGTQQNENFLYLLENFANDQPPARPISGQTWFDTSSNTLNVYDGTAWHPVAAAVSPTAPENPAAGSLWLKTPIDQLFVYDGDKWSFIGPEDVEGFSGTTRAKSVSVLDSNSQPHPVIQLMVNGEVVAIVADSAFTLLPAEGIAGFNNLNKGITLSDLVTIKGNLVGLADRASRLETPRRINTVLFDGQQDITVKSSTTNYLKKGAYITGSDFDGTNEVTWSVDATPNSVIGKVVARNSSGDFSARKVTADLIGNVTGDVTSTGTSAFNIITANEFRGAVLTGNSYSATRLQTGRTINGVVFDGTENITVTAAAGTLTGTGLNTSITQSNLTKVGYLTDLSVQGAGGIIVGNGITQNFRFDVSGSAGRLTANSAFDISIADVNVIGGEAILHLTSSEATLLAGGEKTPALAPETDAIWDLGIPSKRFNKIFSQDFYGNLTGNATTADHATNAANLDGGQIGSLPYQSLGSTTEMLPPGTPGQVLQTAGPGNPPFWGTSFIRGMIMQWYGASSGVPSGWAICDGTNGTPDLRNKFVVGAGSTYTMGASGGSTTATNPSTINLTGTTAAAGAHNHTGSTGSTALSPAQLPAHQHNFTDVYAIVGDYGLGGSTASAYDRNGNYIYPSFYAGNASDGDRDNGNYGFPSVTDSTGSNQGHNHSISTDGSHSHSITVTAASGVISVNAVPPYVALFYIMKL